MDWREATQWASYMFKGIQNSIPMPLYGLSLWGISYLISRGISMERIKQFGRIAKPMLLASLDDVPVDPSELEAQLTELFRGYQPTRLLH